MKRSFLTSAILLIIISLSYGQQSDTKLDTKEEVAISATNLWLTLVTEEKYGESWEGAASLFKKAVTKEQWKRALNNLLPPFGKLISREVVSSEYKTSLPGAPDGEYVIITYKSKFEKKDKATETVTPMKDADGVWRVSGYFVR